MNEDIKTEEETRYACVDEPRKVGLKIAWLLMVALSLFFAGAIYLFSIFLLGLCSGCDGETLNRLNKYANRLSGATFGVVAVAALVSLVFRRRDGVPEVIMFLAIPAMLIATYWVQQTGY